MHCLMLLVAYAVLAAAHVTPTAPGPGDSFTAGSACEIVWKASRTWTNVSIYLMTGSNTNMTRLTTVVSALDGTNDSLSPYRWTCPFVRPYSTIYFYQFTNGNDEQGSTWTARFTITSPSGASELAQYDKQPDGDPIPWGEGHLQHTPPSRSKSSSLAEKEARTSSAHGNSRGPSHGDNKATSTSSTEATTSSRDRLSESTASPRPSGGANSSHGTGHRGTHSTQSAELDQTSASAPTASLPSRRPVSHKHSVTSTTCSSPCPDRGPGVPRTGGMKLASSARRNQGLGWITVMPLSALVFAVVL